MRLLALLIGLAVPSAAQNVAAPRVRLAPVPFGAAAVAPRLAAPTLAPTLASPSLALPPALGRLQGLGAGTPSAFASVASPLSAPSATLPAAPAAAAASSPRPMRLILMGPPGSGKTTYGRRLAAEYGMVHISVGQLLREYAQDRPEVAAVMAEGELVDSALVLGLVRERLSRPDVAERGYVLDGFPRRVEEALPLDEWLPGIGLDAVVHLEVPEAELRRRISARGRADDTPETFANRMDVYRERTLPVLERFRSGRGVLMPDVSSADPEANYARLREILERALR